MDTASHSRQCGSGCDHPRLQFEKEKGIAMSDTKSMDRVIRILDDELTLLMDSGLYREAEKTRKRLEVYMDMRNKAKVALAKLRGESVQDD